MNKTKVVGVRLDPVGEYWLDNLTDMLGLSEADVLRASLELYAKQNGLETSRSKIINSRVEIKVHFDGDLSGFGGTE